MLWRVSILLTAALSLTAAILPESFGAYRRAETAAVTPEEPEVWAEYGLKSAESASYSGTKGNVSVTAWQLGDPTGAFAAFQWQRPAGARSGMSSATFPGGSLMVLDNYLLRLEGAQPDRAALEHLHRQLPDTVRTSLPPLFGYLPQNGRVANSERYLLGNASLARFEPGISPELAAFDRGAEAQLARYRIRGKEVQLTLFSYPTPQIAMERAKQFVQLAGAAVRRAGPLLAVIPGGAENPAAGPVLQAVSYDPKLTWNEHVPKDTPQDAAKMILAIIALAGILIAAALGFGLLFGGSRILARKFGLVHSEEGFTSLHLDRK